MKITEAQRWHQQAEQVAEVRHWLAVSGGTLEDLETKFRGLAKSALARASEDYDTEPVSTNDRRWVTPL